MLSVLQAVVGPNLYRIDPEKIELILFLSMRTKEINILRNLHNNAKSCLRTERDLLFCNSLK